LLVPAPPARAQFAQYTAPGAPERPGEARREGLEQALADARWHLGPIRLEPWFGLQDVGWVDTAEDVAGESESSFTATAGAGLRAYLPTGPKVIWAAHALPQYVWAEDENASRLNGRYGAGFFGFFNRLTVEATATRTEELGIVTPEVLQRANSRAERAELAAEILVAGSLSVFGASYRSWTESLVEPDRNAAVQALDLLDRTETVTRAGLRLRSRGGVVVGLGAEWSETDFERPRDGAGGADRSNSGTAPVLELSNPEGRLVFSLDLAYRSLEPEPGSSFVPYDGVTGTAQLTTGGEGRLVPTLYAGRNVLYALTPAFSYAESDRLGLRRDGLGRLRGRRPRAAAQRRSDRIRGVPDPVAVAFHPPAVGLQPRRVRLRLRGRRPLPDHRAGGAHFGRRRRRLVLTSLPPGINSFVVKAIAAVLSVLVATLALPHAAQGQGRTGYRVGPRDLLAVEVLQVPELNVERRVREDGTIVLPLLGEVEVEGLTEEGVRLKLKTLLESKYMQRQAAEVSVVVKEFRSRPISVIGAVKQPGPLSFPGRWTLLEALTAAGGLASDHGETIYVLRRADNGLTDQVAIPVADLMLRADPRANIPIFANDLINVPPAVSVTIFLVGEVRSPGAVKFQSDERITMLTALARAGGLTDRAARKVTIRRQGGGRQQEIEVDAKRILAGKDPDVDLQDGDVVVVKESFF